MEEILWKRHLPIQKKKTEVKQPEFLEWINGQCGCMLRP